MLRRLLALGVVGVGMASGAVHNIMVGASDHKFRPDSVMAAVGDVISFQFYPTNHSVVRMDPTWPCKPYELVNPKDADGGWWSGFHVVSAFMDPPPSWNITINNTNPIYFYCSAPDSCIKFQMVGVINVNNSSLPISAVASKAGMTDYSLSPGESWQAESGPTPPGSSQTSGPTPNPSVTVVLSTGAIVGIVVGVLAVVSLIGFLFFFLFRKKKNDSVKEAPGNTITPAPEDGLIQMAEHPPVYTDPRYSQLPATGYWGGKAQDQHMGPTASQHPNRISELPSTYDPVEIYTPGPEDMPGHRQ